LPWLIDSPAFSFFQKKIIADCEKIIDRKFVFHFSGFYIYTLPKPLFMEENKSLFGLPVDAEATTSLNDTGRWAKFLSIVGFCFMGLMLLLVAFFGTKITGAMSGIFEFDASGTMGILIVVMILVAVIAALLLYFLFRGANNIRKGLRYNDQLIFNDGLANLRNFFIMYGILSIITLGFSLFGLFQN
jgi:hypothetical protein